MKRNGMRLSDVALWESFLEFMRRFAIIRDGSFFGDDYVTIIPWCLWDRDIIYGKFVSFSRRGENKAFW
jgi:hypothetical protein